MGWMAGEASLAAFHGLMNNPELYSLLFVTLEAEEIPRLDHQVRVLRRVRIMAGKAHTFLERRMIDCSACLKVLDIVTAGAKLPAALCGCKGLRRSRRVVARLALGLGNRVVRACPKEFRLRGRVRIMADRTGRIIHRVIVVRLLKRRLVHIVAGKT